MKKFLSILILVIFGQFQITAVLAGADGTNELSKKNKNISEVKDCFETLNRGIFAFNQGLDKIFFKPIAKGYRVLPQPIRSGTSNILNKVFKEVSIYLNFN